MKIEEAYSVKTITEIIKSQLEIPALSKIWVSGEITSLSFSKAGHIYFSLKDVDGTLLNCTFFAGFNRNINFKLENGIKVLVLGSITVYGARGSYQLNCFQIIPEGEGLNALKLKQLKEKLQKEGLFSESRKKVFPKLPKKIGLITSESGAAIKDFLKMTKENPTLSVELYPAVVQGEQAPSVIIKGIEYFNLKNQVECIVITRGGGSEDDLYCFNDEQLARAIANSKIPTMSAIGHEKDVLISDLVADLRMPTPTAAGRFFAENYKNNLFKIEKIKDYFNRLSDNFVERHPSYIKLQSLKENLINKLERLLPETEQTIDFNLEKLTLGINRIINENENKLESLFKMLHPSTLEQSVLRKNEKLENFKKNLESGIENFIKNKENKLNYLISTLDTLSPLSVLNRGYSVVFDKNRKKVKKSVEQINQGDNLNIQFADGFALCNVLYKEKQNGKQ